MITLGVSLYPEQETLEEIESYLQLASKYGFTKIFTSIFSVPGTRKEVIDYFKNFTKIAHKYGMKVCGDANTDCLKKLGADESHLEVINEMGIDILRMDMCYMDERDVTLINNHYGVGVEMSAGFISAIDAALDKGANPENLSVCHNFYPQTYTGADLESTMRINEHWKERKVKVAIFITSHLKEAHGPWPVHDGLVTVEEHRFMSVGDQVRHILAMDNVDEILFGNAFATEEEFKEVADVMKEVFIHVEPFKDYGEMLERILPHGDLKRLPLGIELEENVSDVEKEILYYNAHQVGEYINYMIRSRWTRIFYKKADIPLRKCDKEYFEKGDVLIVNNNLDYYKAEIQICMKPMKNDGQRNLIGHISKDALCILDLMKKGDIFCFSKEGN